MSSKYPIPNNYCHWGWAGGWCDVCGSLNSLFSTSADILSCTENSWHVNPLPLHGRPHVKVLGGVLWGSSLEKENTSIRTSSWNLPFEWSLWWIWWDVKRSKNLKSRWLKTRTFATKQEGWKLRYPKKTGGMSQLNRKHLLHNLLVVSNIVVCSSCKLGFHDPIWRDSHIFSTVLVINHQITKHIRYFPHIFGCAEGQNREPTSRCPKKEEIPWKFHGIGIHQNARFIGQIHRNQPGVSP